MSRFSDPRSFLTNDTSLVYFVQYHFLSRRSFRAAVVNSNYEDIIDKPGLKFSCNQTIRKFVSLIRDDKKLYENSFENNNYTLFSLLIIMINNRPSADLLLPRSLTGLFSWTHSVGYSPKCFGGGVRPEPRNQFPINDQNWLFSYRFSDLSEQSVLNFRHLNYYTELLPFAHFRLRRATNLPMTMMRKKGKFLN